MKRLKFLRLDAGISLDRLAQMSDVNRSVISRVERHGDYITKSQLERLSGALGWTGEPEGLLEEVRDERR